MAGAKEAKESKKRRDAAVATSAAAGGVPENLTEQMAALRADVDRILAELARRPAEPEPMAREANAATDEIVAETATDERVARLGYAFASPPKVALIRQMLGGGPTSAAQLGGATGLSTGSLYHHLRELVHAGVVETASRNQYGLTDLGRQAARMLFQLAAGAGSAA